MNVRWKHRMKILNRLTLSRHSYSDECQSQLCNKILKNDPYKCFRRDEGIHDHDKRRHRLVRIIIRFMSTYLS